MKKIIIAGAGMGGLSAARTLSNKGFDVTVYEARRKEELAYDWTDDISPDVFSRIGLKPVDSFTKGDWSFSPPGGEPIKLILPPDAHRDVSVERRMLSHTLINELGSDVKVLFETPVEGLVIKAGQVAGVTVGGKEIACDLVIDSCGASSVLRNSLPESYMIEKSYNDDEIFVAYRAFMDRTDAPAPEHPNNVYLLHQGKRGISWCIVHDNYTDVLVGRLGTLTQKDLDESLENLQKENPALGTKVLRGGHICRIPVRFALPVMVGPRYAAVGDSAFMTIPMLGSGIVSGMVAGYELANLLISDKSETGFSMESLWEYQKAFYREFGAKHAGVDVIKRFAITKVAPSKLTAVLSSGLISQKDLAAASSGAPIKITPSFIKEKAKIAVKHFDQILLLAPILSRSNKATSWAKRIPDNYVPAKIKAWAKKLSQIVRG